MNDQDLLRDALEAEAQAQRALLAGDDATASTHFLEAAEHYRRSWERAGKNAYGRLVGMLKATSAFNPPIDSLRQSITSMGQPPLWQAYTSAVATFGRNNDAVGGLMIGLFHPRGSPVNGLFGLSSEAYVLAADGGATGSAARGGAPSRT